MLRQLFIMVLFGAVISMAPEAKAQTRSADNPEPKGVPEQYAGNWVCQTFQPGYNILRPHADPSRPQTDKISTPSTVAVLKFSVKMDGTYETPSAKGHYSFNSVT